MLLLLTSLFGEGARDSLLLLDEPEVSLHPWAIAVFAEAVKLATEDWNKQVFIATHSPVLLSQFAPEHVLAAVVEDGRTSLRRLSEIESLRDLLQEYSTGSLYIAEMVAAQSHPEPADQGHDQEMEEACPPQTLPK
jgi:predicted ATPase